MPCRPIVQIPARQHPAKLRMAVYSRWCFRRGGHRRLTGDGRTFLICMQHPYYDPRVALPSMNTAGWTGLYSRVANNVYPSTLGRRRRKRRYTRLAEGWRQRRNGTLARWYYRTWPGTRLRDEESATQGKIRRTRRRRKRTPRGMRRISILRGGIFIQNVPSPPISAVSW